MNIIVTGGAGFLGSRVIAQLLAAKDGGTPPVEFDRIISFDLAPSKVQDDRVDSVVGDLADPDLVRSVVNDNTVAVFHLAAVLSGGSEEDFDLAYRVNVQATRELLEAARAAATTPRFIFTSSLAVFGGPMPEVVTDTLATQPASTYGAFKSIGELLVNEYSRKGYVDARICRLPTISVRPGRPNSAASSFASGIIREPLLGEPSTVPVPLDTMMWLSSPNTAVTNLVHSLRLKAADLPEWRVMNLPGVSVSVGEMLDALTEVGGQQARDLVTIEPDQRIIDIVCSWPGSFDVSGTLALGFTADMSFADAVRQFASEFAPQEAGADR